MTKTIVAHQQAIAKVFSDDYVFRIPSYQRPYAWTTEQARELLDDLFAFMQEESGAVEDMAPYFLGSVVLIKQEASPEADVVDGQQRLTTLTLLLSVIRANVSETNAAEVTPLLYEKGSTIRGTKDRFRLTLRDRDREFFQTYVQREGGIAELLKLSDKLSDSQRNLRDNAILFSERLSAVPEQKRLQLAQFIVTRCYLVLVATPDVDSAYRIFSVLNSRGLDLSATDILKAEIIGAIAATERDTYTRRWEEIEEDLGRDSFGELFSHIRMVYRKAKPQGTLLREFKDHVPELDRPTRFLDTVLLPMARAYAEIVSSAYESTMLADQVNVYLRWLNRLEFTDWIPPAVAFMIRYRQEPERVLAFFKDLERLAYSMLIRQFGANERIERCSALTRAVESGRDLLDDGSPLQLTPREQHGVYRTLAGPLYLFLSPRTCSTILLRLDALLSGGGATYDYDVITVEHVLPRHPRRGSQWLAWFPDFKDQMDWMDRLGNLALLTRKKNSAASNYDFDKKKTAYFARDGISPFVLTTQVLDKREWTIEVVAQRQADLLKRFEEHFRLQGRKDEPMERLWAN